MKIATLSQYAKHKDGTYVSMDLSDESRQLLDNFVQMNLGLTERVDQSTYHITIIYSRTPVPSAENHAGSIGGDLGACTTAISNYQTISSTTATNDYLTINSTAAAYPRWDYPYQTFYDRSPSPEKPRQIEHQRESARLHKNPSGATERNPAMETSNNCEDGNVQRAIRTSV
mgnify:CR=1 FL=1